MTNRIPFSLAAVCFASIVAPGHSTAPVLPHVSALERTTFARSAPTDVTLAKLWWDLGLFHPFTGPVSRDTWEQEFFKALNKSTLPSADLHQLVVKAISALKDPESLVLLNDEGEGYHYTPVLFEVRGNQVWMVGGLEKDLRKPFGPIAKIGDEPIESFFAKRIGKRKNDPKSMWAALALATQRKKEFSLTFTDSLGHALTIPSADGALVPPTKSLDQLKGLWIEGGWKGLPLTQLAEDKSSTWEELHKSYQALDLRMAHWPYVFETNPMITNLLSLRGTQAPKIPMVRVAREHRGHDESTWERLTPGSSSQTKTVAYPSPNSPIFVTTKSPCNVTLPPLLLRSPMSTALAGWAFPANYQAIARHSIYQLTDTIKIRLRTQSWTQKLEDAKTDLPQKNGHLLSPEAAKALATATILNFDHYFAFTPKADQEALFDRALQVHSSAKTAFEVILRSGWITRDVHTPSCYGVMPNALATMAITSYFPTNVNTPAPVFDAYAKSNGEWMVLRTSGGLKTGQLVTAINGISTAAILRASRSTTPARDESRDALSRASLGTSGLFGVPTYHGDKPAPIPSYRFTIKDPDAPSETEESLTRKDLAPVPSSVPAPEGWSFLANPTLQEVIKGLEQGKKMIVDFRSYVPITYPWYFRSWQIPSPYVTPNTGLVYKTPHEPFGWGSVGPNQVFDHRNAEATYTVRGNFQVADPNPALPGRLAIITNYQTLSLPEGIAAFLKAAFPNNVILAGLPTGGSIGHRAWSFVPAGDGTPGLLYYQPTNTALYVNGANHSFSGVSLDIHIQEEALIAASRKHNDALLGAVCEALPAFCYKSEGR